MQRCIKLAASIFLLALASCALQPTNLQHLNLADINHWNIKGKISLNLDGERKNANFSWLNKGQDYDIRLHGPFGSGAATLKRRSDVVSLNDGKQKRNAETAEQLLFEASGWELPISQLHWWIKALPSPDSSFENTVSTNGDFDELKQQGWRLRYKNYQFISGHRLPGKITATRDDIKLILVIKQWTLKAS